MAAKPPPRPSVKGVSPPPRPAAPPGGGEGRWTFRPDSELPPPPAFKGGARSYPSGGKSSITVQKPAAAPAAKLNARATIGATPPSGPDAPPRPGTAPPPRPGKPPPATNGVSAPSPANKPAAGVKPPPRPAAPPGSKPAGTGAGASVGAKGAPRAQPKKPGAGAPPPPPPRE